jgi:hypothetical protein
MTGVTEIPVRPAALERLADDAAAAATPLVWLLDASVTPAPDALAGLLEHAPGPVASLPVDAAGDVVEALMGRVPESDLSGIVDAVGRHRLPLRHAPVLSLLVERDLLCELAPPDPGRFGWYAGPEWTARLFARRPGWLVPASRVAVDGAPAGSPLHVLRVARIARWRKGETLRELHRSVIGRAA